MGANTVPDWAKKGWDDLHDLEDFLRQYVDKTGDIIDRNRVHVAGFSQGGFLTFNLLCKASDLICSIAPLGMPASGHYVGGPYHGLVLDPSSRGHSNCWMDG